MDQKLHFMELEEKIRVVKTDRPAGRSVCIYRARLWKWVRTGLTPVFLPFS